MPSRTMKASSAITTEAGMVSTLTGGLRPPHQSGGQQSSSIVVSEPLWSKRRVPMARYGRTTARSAR